MTLIFSRKGTLPLDLFARLGRLLLVLQSRIQYLADFLH